MQIRIEPPAFVRHEFLPKRTRYCFIVVVWNEGERIREQLRRMSAKADEADVIVADGDSSDGSLEHPYLREQGVRALLVTKEKGAASAMRMAFHYAIEQGYEGMITVDGNGKDGVEAVSDFIAALDAGFDFIQGSRFLPGGRHARTPMERYLGVRLVMSPLISLGAGFRYTDVTNAFKACSRRFLTDPRVQPVRAVFQNFNLQLYLNCRSAQLGFRVREIPVVRIYPEDGSIPTKITTLRRKWLNVSEMLKTAIGAYNP